MQLKRLADKVITIGKQGTLMARRRAGAILRTDESIRKLFGVLAPRYRERDGGYTRVLRCINNRKGDKSVKEIVRSLCSRTGSREESPALAPSVIDA